MKLVEAGIIAITLFCLAGNAYGVMQVYDSDFGKIKVDLPMVLIPKDGNTGTWIDLVKEGSEKPVISIRMQTTYGEDFKKYATSSGFKSIPIETTTNDGYKIIYYSDHSGTNSQYQPVYHYTAFIDYLKDKGKIVQMWTYSEVNGKEGAVARFDKDQFLEISKSFAVISESEAQAIVAETAKTNQSPGFGSFFAILSLLGAIFIMQKIK